MSKRDREEFFEITPYTTGGYGGNHYVRLEDKGPDRYGSPLMNNTEIEILWPNGEKTTHTVVCETKSDKFHCRDAESTFCTTNYYPFVEIEYNGCKLGKVKLVSIEGIKVRLLE